MWVGPQAVMEENVSAVCHTSSMEAIEARGCTYLLFRPKHMHQSRWRSRAGYPLWVGLCPPSWLLPSGYVSAVQNAVIRDTLQLIVAL